MTNRRRLLIVFMAIALVAVGGLIVIPFAKSLAPPPVEVSSNPIDWSRIEPGSFIETTWLGKPVVVFRPNEDTWAGLRSVDLEVWGPQSSDIGKTPVFVYEALSTFRGCRLNHIPKGSTFLKSDWPGGWMDPCHMGVWDYAGRAYQAFASERLANLVKPSYRLLPREQVELFR